jgi:hypothetical protein
MARSKAQIEAHIRQTCLALPEVTEQPFGGHSAPAWRVRDKMFAVISEDRHQLTVKADTGAQDVLVRSNPDRFFVPKYVGSKGWVGVSLVPAHAPGAQEMAELLQESYCLIAPKRLVTAWEATAGGR